MPRGRDGFSTDLPSPDSSSGASPHRLPGLLTWQIHFLALCLGILALNHWWGPLLGLALVYGAVRLFERRVNPLLLAVFFGLGWGVAVAAMPSIPPMPGWLDDKPKVRVSGVVDGLQAREGQRLRVILDDVVCVMPSGEASPLPGKLVWTWQYPQTRPVPGQRATFTGYVKPTRGFATPGAWDTRFYWARKGVFFRSYSRGWDAAVLGERPQGLSTALAKFRALVRQRLTELTMDLPPDGRALLASLLAGDRYDLDPDLREAMSAAGVAHILALSGLHVGLVAASGWFLASLLGLAWPGVYLRLPRPKLAVLLAVPAVSAFFVLGGGSPSLSRATVMFGAWGALLLMGRGRVLLDGLFLALAVLMLLDPLALHDLGLQMSASAVAGIALFAPFFHRWAKALSARIPDRAWLRPARRAVYGALALLSVSVAANLGLWTVIAVYFGRLSPNLYVNLLWLPLLGSVIMPLGLLGMALSAVPWCEPAASQLLGLAGWSLEYLAQATREAFGAGWLPLLTVIRPGALGLLGAGAALAGLAGVLGRLRQGWLLLGLGASCMVVPLLLPPGDGQMHLTLLDVGQGQAAVIQTPHGERYLVDGGGTQGEHFDVGEAVVAAYLTRQRAPRLEGVVLSHADTDHARGLIYLAEHFRVGWLAHSGRWGGNTYAQRLREAVEAGGIEQRIVRQGDRLDLGDGLVLEVLHPADPELGEINEASVVVRLVWRGKGLALVPGDVEGKGMTRLLDREADLSASVLVLPHHGSSGSLRPRLYRRVNPKLAASSASYLGRWEMPGVKVRQALEDLGIPIYPTNQCGTVDVSWPSPGAEPQVATALPCD